LARARARLGLGLAHPNPNPNPNPNQVRIGSDSCPAIFADPTLPASSSLRRELAEAEAIVLVCKGAAKGGLSPTFLTAIARVLPPRLRRVRA
jgi:hypothetical protein